MSMHTLDLFSLLALASLTVWWMWQCKEIVQIRPLQVDKAIQG
jgi:hypothetical protein